MLKSKIIYYEAKPVGVHDLIEHYWDGTRFIQTEKQIVIPAAEFDKNLRAACAYMDEKRDNGQWFFGSENLIVKDVD